MLQFCHINICPAIFFITNQKNVLTSYNNISKLVCSQRAQSHNHVPLLWSIMFSPYCVYGQSDLWHQCSSLSHIRTYPSFFSLCTCRLECVACESDLHACYCHRFYSFCRRRCGEEVKGDGSASRSVLAFIFCWGKIRLVIVI